MLEWTKFNDLNSISGNSSLTMHLSNNKTDMVVTFDSNSPDYLEIWRNGLENELGNVLIYDWHGKMNQEYL